MFVQDKEMQRIANPVHCRICKKGSVYILALIYNTGRRGSVDIFAVDFIETGEFW
jgi:hypothetical protein